jgi:hypothetical protein
MKYMYMSAIYLAHLAFRFYIKYENYQETNLNKSKPSCICVSGVSILPHSKILLLDFVNCSHSVVFFFSFFIKAM